MVRAHSGRYMSSCAMFDLSTIVVDSMSFVFSHHQAKQFKLNEGYTNTDDYEQCRWAVCDTRRSLGRLQQYLLDAFLRARIPIVGISPFDHLISDRFELVDDDYAQLFQRLEYLLARGYVPMLHGDVLLDCTRHWRIFSGDDLLLKLADYFRPRLCVFLTSVPGILRSDGRVIEQFNVDRSQFDELGQSSANVDVTGSMKNKIMIASDIVKKLSPTCHVFIVHGLSDNAKQLLIESNLHLLDDLDFILKGSTRIVTTPNI
jgi:isopentenyl phosphate kinase